ncbi:hypothetical protein RhiirA5_447331 [Rhizophagus irregularis]|uniref:Protein kinase domain-containing protein n=1 Tax=Rhizophagus irregularis TaxID=588596 RepID=A0A2N0NBD0_9GLOM|nr:hypothetical protein RhiirA5_447331 [Rhizophagus irregularis]
MKKKIASTILWLHDVKAIIHGVLHPNNILIHKDTIKLSDFSRSFEKGKGCNDTRVYDVIPYVNSNMLNQEISYKMNKKSDNI